MNDKAYTPALRFAALTPLYDRMVALVTRETLWRKAAVRCLQLTPTDRVLDVGCGTGTLAIRIARACPGIEIHGIDPDAAVLDIARGKIETAGLDVTCHHGFLAPDSVVSLGKFSKIVSTLVFHQTPLDEKRVILKSMFGLLEPGGKLCIADYGLQRSWLMKTLFRSSIQVLDGYQDTQPNAEGCLPGLIEQAGFEKVCEVEVIPTVTGSVSVYTAVSPASC